MLFIIELVNIYKNKTQYFNLIKKKYTNKVGMKRCSIFSEK